MKGVLPLLKSLFPYLAAILILAELFEASGLSAALGRGARARLLLPRHPAGGRAAGIGQALFGQRVGRAAFGDFRKIRGGFVYSAVRERRLRLGGNGVLPLRRLFCRLQKKTRAARRDRAARQFSRRGARLPAVPRAVNAEMKIIYSLTFSGGKGNVL